MKTAFVSVDKAASEYFGGNFDALIESVIQGNLLLFVRITSVRVRLAAWAAELPAQGRELQLSGFFPVRETMRLLLEHPAATLTVRWVGFRFKEDPDFQKDSQPNPERDQRAWFIHQGEPTGIPMRRADLFLCRSHLEGAVPGPEGQPPVKREWPWGAYETTLLRHLAAAAERFWKNYDPSEPDTAVTKDVVVDWLQAKGVSIRTAEQIDTILRAENLPKGPRGKR